MTDLFKLTASEAASHIREGSLTAEAYAAALIGRVECNSGLNAFSAFDPQHILETARARDMQRARSRNLGLLHGVPISLKDNINTSHLATAAGTPGLQKNFQSRNAPVAEALVRAGAVLFGKNTMHELALGATSNNSFSGAVRNPHNLDYIAGGSSGGTAAAVAALLTPAGIGTDTGGSIRIPASLCGVLGFRPTVRRWPQGGVVPVSSTRDTVGPIARSVEDLQLLDFVVTGAQGRAPLTSLAGVCLGVPKTYFWDRLDKETEKLAVAACEVFEDAGAVLIECDLSPVVTPLEAISFQIVLKEAARDIAAYITDFQVPITITDILMQASSPDVRAVAAMLAEGLQRNPDNGCTRTIDVVRANATALVGEIFRRHRLDAILFPTTPRPAARVGEDVLVELDGAEVPTFPTFIRNTDPGSVLGLPGITLPVGLSSRGLPVGIALDALPRNDAKLLSIAAAMEDVLTGLSEKQREGALDGRF